MTNFDSLLPGGGELGPVPRATGTRTSSSPRSRQDVGTTQGGHRLRDGPHVGDGVALPGDSTLLVEMATPDIHDGPPRRQRRRPTPRRRVLCRSWRPRASRTAANRSSHSPDISTICPPRIVRHPLAMWRPVGCVGWPRSCSSSGPPGGNARCLLTPASPSSPALRQEAMAIGGTWSRTGMGHAESGRPPALALAELAPGSALGRHRHRRRSGGRPGTRSPGGGRRPSRARRHRPHRLAPGRGGGGGAAQPRPPCAGRRGGLLDVDRPREARPAALAAGGALAVEMESVWLARLLVGHPLKIRPSGPWATYRKEPRSSSSAT